MDTNATSEAVGLTISIPVYLGSATLMLEAARLRIRALPSAWRDHDVIGQQYDHYLDHSIWHLVRLGLGRNLRWLGAVAVLFLLLAVDDISEGTRSGMVGALALALTASERRQNKRETDHVARTYSLPSLHTGRSLSKELYWAARLLLWTSVLASGCFAGGLVSTLL